MIAVTLVAAACGYFSWQNKVVSDRQEALGKLESLLGGTVTAANYDDCVSAGQTFPETGNRPGPKLSWVREWLGDEAIVILYVPESLTERDAQEIISDFPEATIVRSEPPRP